MTLQTDLVSFVQSHPALTPLQSDRFYPITLPQEPTLPASTYLMVSAAPRYGHDNEKQFNPQRIQFDFFAASYLEVHALAEAMSNALRNYPVTVFQDNRQDIPEPELSRFRITMDFRFMEVS